MGRDVRALRATAARRTAALTGLLTDARRLDDARRPLPATRTAPHVNDDQVLIWMYRGSGHPTIGERVYRRERGDAIWIPADVEHHAGTAEDSIGLPVGDVATSDVRFGEPIRTNFPSSWDDYMLYCSVSARTMLRPGGYDPRHVLDVFREQLAAERARRLPMPGDVQASAAATDFLRRLGARGEATARDLPHDVHQAFRRDTGMTFARWQNAARMRIARDLLANGAKPATVARRVGYTQLSNFSRAFARFHGVPPSEYRRRESGRPE